MFDVRIEIKAKLMKPEVDPKTHHNEMHYFTAESHVNLRQDEQHKRWIAFDGHGSHIRNHGRLWNRFQRHPTRPGSVILLNEHNHQFAELENFPEYPREHSKGTAYLSNLNFPRCWYTSKNKGHEGEWFGSWAIDQSVQQRNIPIVDPNDGAFRRAIDACSMDSGWRYDTSSGWGLSGGAVLGGGFFKPTLVFKRKEPNDTRKWEVHVKALGAGVMTPGIGLSGSDEDNCPSTPVTEVRVNPQLASRFTPADFGGGVVMFDVGFGASAPVVGGSYSTTTIMFVGGVHNGFLPDLTTVKAVVQIRSGGLTAQPSAKAGLGAQALLYYGNGLVKRRS